MKILIISDYILEYGGVEKIILLTKKYFEDKGHTVKLFGSKKFIKNKVAIFNIKNYFKLKKLIKEFNPDLILINNIRFFLSPSILLAIPKNKLTFMTFHDYSYICPKIWNINSKGNFCNNKIGIKCVSKKCLANTKSQESYIYNLLRYLKTLEINFFIKKRIKYVFTPSEYITSNIKKVFIKQNVFTLRNPFKIDINNTLKLKEKNKYYLYVGRIEKEKGVMFMLEGFNIFLKNNPNEKLLIIGNGSLLAEIKIFIKKNNLDKNIFLKGFIKNKNLNQYYNNAKCTIIPSLYVEGFGLVVIESLLNRTPTLINDIGGLKEQSEIFDNSHIYKYNNLEDFIKKLKLFRDNKQCSFENNFKIIKKDFSLEKYYNEIMNNYNKFR